MAENIDLFFLNPEDPEWDAAWSAFPDRCMYNDGEVLQYMGTVLLKPSGLPLRHEFRHRSVPGTNERKYWGIPVSPGWRPVERGMFWTDNTQ